MSEQETICNKCYGKGYSTEYKGKTVISADFIGDKQETIDEGGIRVNICCCNRGKDLLKYFEIKNNLLK